MKWISEQTARARVWLRERKEAAEAKKLERQATIANDPHGGHGRFFLLHIPATATVLAAFVEVYWAILFCIEATGHLQGNFDMAAAWNAPLSFAWDFAFSGNLFVLLGLLAATAPIVMISMVWLPVQFAMRGFGRWRRGTLIAVGLLANAIVILSGTVVMNANRQEQVRAGLVQEQSAEQGRAALQARYNAVEQRWRTLTEPSNTTLQAQAARAGVAGWDAYIAAARQQATAGTITPQRLALIERARGSAVAAEAYQHQMDDLTGQIAAAAPVAATQAVVRDDVGAGMNGFAQQVQVYRPPLIAIGCTLVGILGAWWTLAMLLHMNPRDVMRSGWADEGHRIEDLREQAPVAAEPMKPPREVVTDAETGEELVKIKPREYWRKAKGKKQRVETQPEIPPDEMGVPADGGGRIASTPAVDEVEAPPVPDAPVLQDSQADGNQERSDPASQETESETQPEPSEEPSDELLDAYMAVESAPEMASTENQPQQDEAVEQYNDGSDAHVSEAENRTLIPAHEPTAVEYGDEANAHGDNVADDLGDQDEPPVQPRALLAAAE